MLTTPVTLHHFWSFTKKRSIGRGKRTATDLSSSGQFVFTAVHSLRQPPNVKPSSSSLRSGFLQPSCSLPEEKLQKAIRYQTDRSITPHRQHTSTPLSPVLRHVDYYSFFYFFWQPFSSFFLHYGTVQRVKTLKFLFRLIRLFPMTNPPYHQVDYLLKIPSHQLFKKN